MGSRLRRTRIRATLRSARTRAVLALGGVAVLAVSGTSASWSDSVPVSGINVSALTVPPATNIACTLTNNTGAGYSNLAVTATVPTGSQYTYSFQMQHHLHPSDGEILNVTGTPTVSGSTLTYNFQDNDIIQDSAASNSQVDYFVNITVSLSDSPAWKSTVTQITFDADNVPGILGIGGGVVYGTPRGQTSPNGVAGACSTA